MAQPQDMVSPLSPHQCAERINAATDSGWSLFGGHQVIGKLDRGGGALVWRHRFTQNSFRPILRVRFKPVEGGAQVRCRAGLSYFTLIFSAVWCGFVLMIARFTTLVYLIALVRGDQPPMDAIGGLFPLMMLAFFVALAGGGWMLNRGDIPLLVNFVRKKLETGGGYLNLDDI